MMTKNSKKSPKSRLLLGFIVLFVAAWVGIAFYTGKVIEEKKDSYFLLSEKNIAMAMQELSLPKAATDRQEVKDFIRLLDKLEVVQQGDYHRGIFSSQVNYLVRDKNNPNDNMVIAVNIDHGPFPLSSLASFNLMPKLLQAEIKLDNNSANADIFAITAGKSPFVLTTQISYSTAAQYELVLIPIKSESMQLDFSGMTITASDDKLDLSPFRLQQYGDTINFGGGITYIEKRSDDIKIKLALGKIELELPSESISVSLGSSTLVVDENITNFKMYKTLTGSHEYIINNITLADPSSPLSPVISVDQLSLNQDAYKKNAAENGFDATIKLALDNFKINDLSFGSGYIVYAINNLDMVGMSDFLDNLQTFSARGWIQPEDRQKIAAFFKTKPVVKFSPISWKNSQGEAKIDLTINLQQPRLTGSYFDAAKLFELSTKDVDIKFSAAKPMLTELFTHIALLNGSNPDLAKQQATMQIVMATNLLQNNGFIVQQGDTITSHLYYANGQTQLNGTILPADAIYTLMQLML